MCVKGQRDWILRSNDRTRWSKDKKIKGLRDSGLASTKKCEECTKVFEFGKLLQIIC